MAIESGWTANQGIKDTFEKETEKETTIKILPGCQYSVNLLSAGYGFFSGPKQFTNIYTIYGNFLLNNDGCCLMPRNKCKLNKIKCGH